MSKQSKINQLSKIELVYGEIIKKGMYFCTISDGQFTHVPEIIQNRPWSKMYRTVYRDANSQEILQMQHTKNI